MPFRNEPLVESDLRPLAELDEDAYIGNPMRESISSYAVASPEQREQHLQWTAKQTQKRFAEDKYSAAFKVVDENCGEIAGSIEWKKPGFQPPRPPKKEDESKSGVENQEMSPCLNLEAARKFGAMWGEAQKRHMGDRTDYACLARLIIAKKYQRQGAGDQLVKLMLADADENGWDVYVGATPAVRKLLENNGFEALEEIPLLDGSFIFTIMLRLGRGKK